MRFVGDDSVHLTVTSPPYVTTLFQKGQEFDYASFLDHYRAVVKQIYRATVPGGRFALNVGDIVTKYRYPDLGSLFRVPLGSDLLQISLEAGFILVERFIWDKGYTRNMGGPLLGSFPYPMTVYNNVYFEYIGVKASSPIRGDRPVRQQRRGPTRQRIPAMRIRHQSRMFVYSAE